MGVVSFDDVWGIQSADEQPPANHKVVDPAPPPQQLGSGGRHIPVDAELLMQLLDELHALRAEQSRNAQSLWITLTAGFLLVLLSLSSVSRALHAVDATAQRLHWSASRP